jgi:hypothetical protein
MYCIVAKFVGRILQLFLPTDREIVRGVPPWQFYFTKFLTSGLFTRLIKSNRG